MSVEHWPMLISFHQPLRRSSVLACSPYECTFLPSLGTPLQLHSLRKSHCEPGSIPSELSFSFPSGEVCPAGRSSMEERS